MARSLKKGPFAENAYLKKLQALVEERIVRERGKEPKPSKD